MIARFVARHRCYWQPCGGRLVVFPVAHFVFHMVDVIAAGAAENRAAAENLLGRPD